jgi:hypothetical protein
MGDTRPPSCGAGLAYEQGTATLGSAGLFPGVARRNDGGRERRPENRADVPRAMTFGWPTEVITVPCTVLSSACDGSACDALAENASRGWPGR